MKLTDLEKIEFISDLTCYDTHKSFYGKAKLVFTKNEVFLCSYNTLVCKIDKHGIFVRLWNGYSATTMRHVNSFLHTFHISGGGKKWWDAQPCQI